ncbi:receptor-like protein EIX2 [Mangifera indica]|uniref:receptor-like protein EIX2 n=1 Tax=Mangifera indica TaxID=29780 RepID=UPI001CF97A93|nr:receptor-like protein EIX2 [Mangifera indica]
MVEALIGIVILRPCLSRFHPLPPDWFRFSLNGKWKFDVTLGCLTFPLPDLTGQAELLPVHLPAPVPLVSQISQQRAADSDAILCREEEKEALLVFRRGLIDRFGTLSSWGSKDRIDCCEWTRVLCLQTGHVCPIPEFHDSVKNLETLSLFHAGFEGPIPDRHGNLSRLQLLDLSGNNGLYNIGNIEWSSHLSSLRYLDLSGCVLPGENDRFQVINKLPLLNELRLVLCNLPQIMSWNPLKVNATASFLTLDLTGNHVTNSIYPWLFNVSSNLHEFNLNFNLLQGEIPEALGHYMVSLTGLFLKSNELDGGFPKSIGNMSCLLAVDLSSNNLRGQHSGFLSKSIWWMHREDAGVFVFMGLRTLDLQDKALSGKMPEWIGESLLILLVLRKIPTGTQLQSFNASIYEGNPGQCGLPLPKKCPGEEPAQAPSTTTGEIPEDEFISFGFYVSLSLGFIVGFWGVCGSLVHSQSCRHAYLKFLGDMKDRIYVTAAINFAKLKLSFDN